MRRAFLLLPLAVALAGRCTALANRVITNDLGGHRNLKDHENDIETEAATEERLNIPGLKSLKPLFQNNPTAAKALEKNPTALKTLQDNPALGKQVEAQVSQPGAIKKLRSSPRVDKLASSLAKQAVQKNMANEALTPSQQKLYNNFAWAVAVVVAATVFGVSMVLRGRSCSE